MSMTYLDGLIFAEERGYIVKDFVSPMKSFSVMVDDVYAIAMNPAELGEDEAKTALYHELGHCETDSFYNERVATDVRQKHENRADKWAIKMLIPEDELDAAVADGYTDIWSLAERFGVTADFARKAIWWYQHGNLSVE